MENSHSLTFLVTSLGETFEKGIQETEFQNWLYLGPFLILLFLIYRSHSWFPLFKIGLCLILIMIYVNYLSVLSVHQARLSDVLETKELCDNSNGFLSPEVCKTINQEYRKVEKPQLFSLNQISMQLLDGIKAYCSPLFFQVSSLCFILGSLLTLKNWERKKQHLREMKELEEIRKHLRLTKR